MKDMKYLLYLILQERRKLHVEFIDWKKINYMKSQSVKFKPYSTIQKLKE